MRESPEGMDRVVHEVSAEGSAEQCLLLWHAIAHCPAQRLSVLPSALKRELRVEGIVGMASVLPSCRFSVRKLTPGGGGNDACRAPREAGREWRQRQGHSTCHLVR